MERRLVAILAADVVGYARLMGKDEAGTLERLKSLRKELVQPKITARKGRVVKLMGDGLLAEFPSVVEAVRCAVDIQQCMLGRDTDVPEERRISLRIGVNLGDIIVEGTDIYGDGVNVAARLETLADPDGICISGTVLDHVKGKVGLKFVDLGARKVKNIDQPVPVYRIALDRAEDTGETAEASAASLKQPDKPSIAVLPFDNMSSDPEQEYFADGLTEDIITELSRYNDFRVIARNSTFGYKGQSPDVRQVGRDLNIQFVVEGSVRRAGQRVRVTAQLVDAATGDHVWAERYDRDLADIFDIQDEITSKIASSVGDRIFVESMTRALRRPTENIDAYDLVQKAWAHFLRLNAKDNEAARLFAQQACAIAPDYAQAVAVLALTHVFAHIQNWAADPELALRSGYELALKAVAMEPLLARGRVALIFAELWQRRHSQALDSADSLIRLNPNLADAYAWRAIVLSYSGLAAVAVASMHRAIELNPHYPSWYGLVLGRALLLIGEFVEAERELGKSLRATPEYPQARLHLAATLAAQGRKSDAAAEITALLQASPGYSLSTIGDRQPYKDPDDIARVVDWLRTAGLPE